MSFPFDKFHHICIAVYNIDEKIKYFESIGIGPWSEYPPLSEYEELEVPNFEGFKKLRFVQAQIGDIEIQLVQPSMEHETPQKKFLDSHGEGVYHIGFVVDDANEAEKTAESRGLKTGSRGRRSDSSGFNYYDTKDQAGVVILTRKSSPSH